MVERLEGCEREKEREKQRREKKERERERERRLAAIGGQTGTDGYRNDGSS